MEEEETNSERSVTELASAATVTDRDAHPEVEPDRRSATMNIEWPLAKLQYFHLEDCSDTSSEILRLHTLTTDISEL